VAGVTKGDEAMITTILVGTDNSARATRAVEYAADLAEQLGATLRIVAVHQPVVVADATSQQAVYGVQNERQIDEALDAHVAILGPIAERLRERGIDARVTVASGDPSASVIELAKNGGGDLVVVGNKGLGGWRRLFGSVPSRVLAAGRVPVVVVPTG
jgi:nucleotide-binding universal stress UspA family protein